MQIYICIACTHIIYEKYMCMYEIYEIHCSLSLSKLTDTRIVPPNKFITLSSIQIMLPLYSLNWNLRLREEEEGEKSTHTQKKRKERQGNMRGKGEKGKSAEREITKEGILEC